MKENKKRYLVLLLIPLLIALAGCGKKYFAPPPEPNAPSNLTATAVSYKQIHLSWQDNCDDEDYFRVLCPTMWGIQHQTIATLPPNTTSFDHHTNLQPMTEYEYYVCVHRGEEHTCSNRAYATTPCPVEILRSVWSRRMEPPMLWLELQNKATESCRAEITAYFYKDFTDELEGTEQKTFNLAPLEVSEYGTYGIEYTGPEPWTLHCTVEVTDVEIEY